MKNLSNAIVLLSAGLVVLLLSGQAFAEPAAQLPEFDSWCPPQYVPEILLEIRPGYPTDIAEADLDGNGQVEILLATQEIVGDSGDWISYLFRITDPLAGG